MAGHQFNASTPLVVSSQTKQHRWQARRSFPAAQDIDGLSPTHAPQQTRSPALHVMEIVLTARPLKIRAKHMTLTRNAAFGCAVAAAVTAFADLSAAQSSPPFPATNDTVPSGWSGPIFDPS